MGTRIDRRFDYLRKQTEQDASRAGQEQNDALQRQAAAKGRLGSGAFQKVQMQQADSLARQKQNALEGVESQRDAALAQSEEAQANRDFAKSERLGTQDFQTVMDQKGWDRNKLMFDTQRADQREQFQFSKDMAINDFNRQDLQMAQAQKNWEQQMSTQNSQWKKQFKLDKQVSIFNMDMARRAQTLAEKPGMFDQFMSPFGQAGRYGGDVAGRAGIGGSTREFISSPTGGGGGGGGKIICTEYCRQGWISEEVLKGDLEYASKHLSLETRANYLMWAQYVVPAMEKYPILLYFMWPLTYNWVHYMAWKVGKHPHKPLFGPLVEAICTPISNILGKTIRKYKRSSNGYASLSTRT